MGRAFEYRKATKMKRWGHMARVFTKLGKNLDKLGELVLEETITLSTYLSSSANIMHEIDKLEIVPNMVNIFFIILFFISFILEIIIPKVCPFVI